MSLVVANVTSKSIAIVSDTKLTYVHGALNPYVKGIGKVVILNNQCAVAFAGIVEHAKSAISSLSVSDSSDQVVSKLSQAANNPDFSADFIVAVNDEQPHLISIKDAVVTKTSTAWIGDYDAFRLYQKYFTATVNPDDELYAETTRFHMLRIPEGDCEAYQQCYSRMHSALSAVCDSQKINSVGGMVIPIMLHKGDLRFGSYLSIQRKPLTDEEIDEIDENVRPIDFGDASTGTFSVNANGENHTHFAVHINEGKLGIVFIRSQDLILTPEIFCDVDEIDFQLLIEEQFREGLAFHKHHHSANYFQKAEQKLCSQNFIEAEELLTKGIYISSKSWHGNSSPQDLKFDSLKACTESKGLPLNIDKSEANNLRIAFYMRGMCRCNQNDLQSGLQDFEESLMLDKTYYPAMLSKAKALANLGLLDEAINAAKSCCHIAKEKAAFELCGQLLLMSGKHIEAYQYLQNSKHIANSYI